MVDKPCETCSWFLKDEEKCYKHWKSVRPYDTCPDADDYGPNYRLLDNIHSESPKCCDCKHFHDWDNYCYKHGIDTTPSGGCSDFVRK